MRAYAYDVIIFLNRGQPLHKAHKKIYDRALALGKILIPVFGSHRKAMSTYNPFTSDERMEMTKACFDEEDLERMHFTTVCDHPYNNDTWLAEVHMRVREILMKAYPEQAGWSDYDSGTQQPLKIGIIGFKKDDTSAYLDWFPQWEFIDTATFSKGVSATDIRNSFFMEMIDVSKLDFENNKKDKKLLESNSWKKAVEGASNYDWRSHVPLPVVTWLAAFKIEKPNRCKCLVAEYLSNLRKRADKECYPYAIIENTVDAVVTKSAFVLLVKRGNEVGQGLWALPGGFMNEYEDKLDAALRELKEETHINLFYASNYSKQNQFHETRKALLTCLKNEHEFAHPMRSTRGRVITKAFHFDLPKGGDFPYIKAGDDAAEAKWFSISDLPMIRDQLFEEHYDIIEFFVQKASA